MPINPMDMYNAEEGFPLPIARGPVQRPNVVSPAQFTEEFLAIKKQNQDRADAIAARKAEAEAERLRGIGENVRQGIVGGAQGFQAGKQMVESAQKRAEEQEAHKLAMEKGTIERDLLREQIQADIASKNATTKSTLASAENLDRQTAAVQADLDFKKRQVKLPGTIYDGKPWQEAIELAKLNNDIANVAKLDNERTINLKRLDIDKKVADAQTEQSLATTALVRAQTAQAELTTLTQKKATAADELKNKFHLINVRSNGNTDAIKAEYQNALERLQQNNQSVRAYNATLKPGERPQLEVPEAILNDAFVQFTNEMKDRNQADQMFQTLLLSSDPMTALSLEKMKKVTAYVDAANEIDNLQKGLGPLGTAMTRSAEDSLNLIAAKLDQLGMTESARSIKSDWLSATDVGTRQSVIDKAKTLLRNQAKSDFNSLANSPASQVPTFKRFLDTYASTLSGGNNQVDPMWQHRIGGGK